MNKLNLFLAAVLGSITGFLVAKKSVCKQPQVNKLIAQYRTAEHPIDPLFINRWSPRAMSGQTVSKSEINSLLEAMRWAPSSYNEQPWRVLYVFKDSPEWQTFFDLLVPFNQEWVKNAGALMLLISKNNFTHNNTYSISHSFDAGAASQNLALQGDLLGLVVHGMAGFDYQKAKEILNIPQDYTVEAMYAIGKPGEITRLPEALRTTEHPSDRKKIEQFATEGKFIEAIK
ncbi:nitroreductase [Candidatus Dependentiae bacterium Noda2021]|nr:nitroreductase [Candidatus Dependentiae bacterium Noda2021]